MVTVKKLRDELAKKQTKGIKELELVDELVFSNQRMNEFLTTKMVIDKELEIQNIFKQKFKKYLKNNFFVELRNFMIKNNFLNTIPTQHKDNLYLKMNSSLRDFLYGENSLSSKTLKYFNKEIYRKYQNYNLKIRPLLNIKTKISLPIWIHVNNDKYEFNMSFTFKPKGLWQNELEAQCQNYSPFIEVQSSYGYVWKFDERDSNFNERYCKFKLNQKYNLENINNIKIRYGRFKIESMDFYDG